MGTAAALGLVVAPLTGSAVVVAITAHNAPQMAAAPTATAPNDRLVVVTESPPSERTTPAPAPESPAAAADSPGRNLRRLRDQR